MLLVNRGYNTFKVGEYLSYTQPDVLKIIWKNMAKNMAISFPEEEFTPFQKHLERLMRQAPRPGRAGAIRGEVD